MTAVTLWLLISLNESAAPILERFPTQKDCESVRAAMLGQIRDNYRQFGDKNEPNPVRLRCIPATVAR